MNSTAVLNPSRILGMLAKSGAIESTNQTSKQPAMSPRSGCYTLGKTGAESHL